MARIIGTPRDDDLRGTSSSNTPTGADEIFGLGGNDHINGLSGADRLFGGRGADRIDGSWGDDLILGEDDDDVLEGGLGADQLFGGHGNDVIFGDEGDDLLSGGRGEDDLLGGADNDLLDGGEGNDALFGDAGDDRLNGGPGADLLSGDEGADRFVLADLDAVDLVLDFDLAEGDGLDISPLVQGALDAGASLDEVVRYDVTPAGTVVAIDPDGGGGGFEPAARLLGVQVGFLSAAALGVHVAAPVAADDSASTNLSTPITIDVLANDEGQGDRLTIVDLDTTGTRGMVTIDPGGLTISYTPDPTFFGIDGFSYTISNSLGATDEATVHVEDIRESHSLINSATIEGSIRAYPVRTDTHYM